MRVSPLVGHFPFADVTLEAASCSTLSHDSWSYSSAGIGTCMVSLHPVETRTGPISVESNHPAKYLRASMMNCSEESMSSLLQAVRHTRLNKLLSTLRNRGEESVVYRTKVWKMTYTDDHWALWSAAPDTEPLEVDLLRGYLEKLPAAAPDKKGRMVKKPSLGEENIAGAVQWTNPLTHSSGFSWLIGHTLHNAACHPDIISSITKDLPVPVDSAADSSSAHHASPSDRAAIVVEHDPLAGITTITKSPVMYGSWLSARGIQDTAKLAEVRQAFLQSFRFGWLGCPKGLSTMLHLKRADGSHVFEWCWLGDRVTKIVTGSSYNQYDYHDFESRFSPLSLEERLFEDLHDSDCGEQITPEHSSQRMASEGESSADTTIVVLTPL